MERVVTCNGRRSLGPDPDGRDEPRARCAWTSSSRPRRSPNGSSAASARCRSTSRRPTRDRPPPRTSARALAAVEAFLTGDVDALDGLSVDLEDRTGWDRLVLGAVRGIPAGSTASYGEVARMIGRTGAARAVGGAVGRNPIGLVIPCHRVIAGDGSIGGYGGGWWGGRQAGLELKRELLAREGVDIGMPAPDRLLIPGFAAR